MTPFVVCLPSNDAGFRRVVQQLLVQSNVADPSALEDRLRPIYPRIHVRRRELSGEPSPTWYAYRDGFFGPDDPDRWWRDDGCPSGRVSVETGRITWVNEALEQLYGTPAERIVGLAYPEFVVPEARLPAEILFGTIVEHGELRSVARLRRPDGETILCEYYARLDGGEMQIWLRLIESAGTRW